MMRYICIDDGAVTELISGRQYQSIDFKEGKKLIEALSGDVQFLIREGKIVQFQDQEGVFLTTPGSWKTKKYVVIDCEQSSLFEQLSDDKSLTSFQKLLRFCKKYWTQSVYNNSEKVIGGTTKAVIFPLPYENQAPFRVVMERHPLRERLKARGMDGHFLLVYKAGRESGNAATEVADETVFRKVFGRLPEIYQAVSASVAELDVSRSMDQLASTDLTDTLDPSQPIHMPFSIWLPRLTERQRKFVLAPASTPHRLQGPAGTGKTLSLILRTVHILNRAERCGEECHALLVTHSEATRETISDALISIDEHDFQSRLRGEHMVSLSIQTLASLCAEFLQTAISETEFVDRDAQDSKLLQQMYMEVAIERARKSELPSFSPHLSATFREFLHGETNDRLSSMFQHEVGVLIKGRAGEALDVYKECPPLEYGLPIQNVADKGFAFTVFREYQAQLEEANQFDTDDVVISAVGQLDTPIWRRRRSSEAFDFIAVDETHLFNINELQVFHHFTRGVERFPISFTVDRAQAVGDRGWNDIETFDVLLRSQETDEATTEVNTIFRCAPHIAEFCCTVLASGATLFTRFANTMSSAQNSFTIAEERRSQQVRFVSFSGEEALIVGAFQTAEKLQEKTASKRSQVLITTLSDELLSGIEAYATGNNKPVTYLKRRGDFRQISSAQASGHVVVAHADFVGGLEFNVVVIVGVDRGRVPHEGESTTDNSRSFANYAAHNRLYVASSRAKFALCLLGDRSRGPSELLRSAIANGLVEVAEEL
ncbi:MAG: UvrD-helicase domain-containing protein [Candidatus Poribacteria bacterium]|nr:UvrD-helicase domain-containing protein [Candidatus Poribacteria bacterium]